MVRRRHAYLVALILVSVGILYLTVTQTNRTFNNLYPQFIPVDFRIPILKGARPPKEPAIAADKNCSSGGSLMYENFCVTSPYDNEVKNTTDEGLVTLCTQGTVEFLQHIVVLCHRWSAPISVAVYSPPEDWVDAHILVQLLRQCDSCVRYWVNWHFIYPKDKVLPSLDTLELTRDCSSVLQTKRPKKRRSQGTYPINVGRNLARRLARTPFVFSIDIELYPSLHIPAKFERMLQSQALGPDNQVWVLPVFEVHSKYRAPLLKSELRSMFAKRQAISFHQYRCNICHRIPNLTQWMTHGVPITSEVEDSLEPLKVWSTVKRNRRFKLHEWEPFFIGTTKDPEFDIRLSWEGKQNKMQMAYEMCMRDYDFHIVENAFLVHTPGINVYNATKEKEREKHYAYNRKVMTAVRKDLNRKYGSKNHC